MEYNTEIQQGVALLSDAYKDRLLSLINELVREQQKQDKLDNLLDVSFGCFKDDPIQIDIDELRGRNRVVKWS